MGLRTLWILLVVVVVLFAAGAVFVTHFNLAAIKEPGHVETSVATWGKDFFIRRASRHGIPERPNDRKASIAEGDVLYGMDCSMCHGRDGHAHTDMGLWMYPRAADLTSPHVQAYSDQELFWIVRNGIRLSGMPAFGKVESSDHIWNLVDYVRSIPRNEQKTNASSQGPRP